MELAGEGQRGVRERLCHRVVEWAAQGRGHSPKCWSSGSVGTPLSDTGLGLGAAVWSGGLDSLLLLFFSLVKYTASRFIEEVTLKL